MRAKTFGDDSFRNFLPRLQYSGGLTGAVVSGKGEGVVREAAVAGRQQLHSGDGFE